MAYLLESKNEFQRLEEQAKVVGYGCADDLGGLSIDGGSLVLDAGSGSGIATRYLAERFRDSEFVGCDLSIERLEQARVAATNFPNVRFEAADLRALPFRNEGFDLIVCRYVLHHLSKCDQNKAVSEFFRCLKSGGRVLLVEPDGLFINLHPQPTAVQRALAAILSGEIADLYCGRKLESVLWQAGFSTTERHIQLHDVHGERLDLEIGLMSQRLAQAEPLLAIAFNDAELAREFKVQFLLAMKSPGSVYFHNKFVVAGQKR